MGGDNGVYMFIHGSCVKTMGPRMTRQIQSERQGMNDVAASLAVAEWVILVVVNNSKKF